MQVLGPFPQSAREQHFVSPSYPFPRMGRIGAYMLFSDLSYK